MEWNIPGTVLSCPVEEAASVQERFGSMFNKKHELEKIRAYRKESV